MHLSLNLTSLLVSTFLTGLTAGLCFTWGNAVTPGIGRLDDLGYLHAFQQMNRAILNPIFIGVFMGPAITHIANIFLFKSATPTVFWLILSASILYLVGLVLMTIIGNVPLNEMIDKVDLLSASPEELKTLRDQFEVRWNQFHLVRTITTSLSFALLIISIVLHNKQ
jgi:uncharacterized membrane protein